MAIDQIGAATGGGTTPGTSKKQELGQDAFLQLLVAQMRNQDPTKPADPTEYLSQLAQFSTVTGVQGMRESIQTLSDSLRGSQVLGGTSLVGRDVLVATNSATLREEGEVHGEVTMPAGANEALLLVTDASGQLVRQMPIPFDEKGGTAQFEWDGMNGRGERVPAGDYKVSAVANVGGYAQQMETRMASRVGSVSIDPTTSSLTLNTDIGPIELAAVRQVM
jgi:flagellar basal-body rod modification protein FlgD